MAVEAQPTVSILNIAWTRYAQLDAVSNKHSRPHYRWRRWISILGVLFRNYIYLRNKVFQGLHYNVESLK